jgi:hypothetical protein
MSVVLNWNGKEVPEELRDLPKGRYVLQPVDDLRDLTADEDTGLAEALKSLLQGKGVESDVVFARIESKLRR